MSPERALRGWWHAAVRAAALLGLSAVFAFPLIWMFSFSLRRLDLPPPVRFELFAPPFAFENYARLLVVLPLAQFLWNSLQVVLWAVPLTVLTGSWAGFAMAQLPRPLQRLCLGVSVALLLVPAPALWVPRFLIFNALGFRDTLVPLVAPALMGTSPFYVIMFYIAFARVPRDVYDSARMDGASLMRTWATVALPGARPTAIAVALLSFVFHWSNYADPFLYLRSEANYTLPVGIQILRQSIQANWPLLMAAASVMAAPVVLVFLLAQRFFLQEPSVLARWRR